MESKFDDVRSRIYTMSYTSTVSKYLSSHVTYWVSICPKPGLWLSFFLLYFNISFIDHELWKESLNSDWHKYHQYLQNEQSLHNCTRWTKKRQPQSWLGTDRNSICHMTTQVRNSYFRHDGGDNIIQYYDCMLPMKPCPMMTLRTNMSSTNIGEEINVESLPQQSSRIDINVDIKISAHDSFQE
jgi:hypothetical protein